jgi:hypothetical protein
MIAVPRRRKLARSARGAGRGLLTAVVVAVLVLGVLRAGSRYFYCDAMGTAFANPCCGGAHHEDADSAQVEARPDDCCKARSLGSLPFASIPILPPPPAAPFVAVVQNDAVAPLQVPPPRGAIGANPTGPPPDSPSTHRTRLMVFLI